MQVVKNFGFTRPFIKTMQPGNYIRFAEEIEKGRGEQPVNSGPRSHTNVGGASRIPSAALSIDAFKDWCRTMRDSWDEPLEQDAGTHTKWRSFDEARAFARSLGLRNGAEWREYSKGALPHLGTRPADIPGCPERIYRDEGWAGYRDWLGLM